MSQYINYGIDLGTTNSCVAAWQEDDVRIFQNNLQMNVTPSAVHVTKSGRILVGLPAYNALLHDEANVAREFKRWIGQKDTVTFLASGKEMDAEALSAEVLKALKGDVLRLSGENLSAAVITVPAAFGTLQCEATARAAKLAGFQEVHLLQEPIAAAIAYGMNPGVSDQYWLVFDLGGGTLDIAVVSTKDKRLSVLEHRGNNQLGGKDIDRLIVEKFLLPHLEGEYCLPDSDEPEYQTLYRQLLYKAEEAKKTLSTMPETVVGLFDFGEDWDGETIETEMTLTQAELEEAMERLLDKCLTLAEEALEAARITGQDLKRIILVGGPTQMPVIRETLSERLQAPVDYSLDPMTVVARGAAVYASTVEKMAMLASDESQLSAESVSVELAFAMVSGELQTPVKGLINDVQPGLEIKLDAHGGFWSSGWLPVTSEGDFDAMVSLKEGKTTTFKISLRDASGNHLSVHPTEFAIRHGLVLSAPPLPHTISVEIKDIGGTTKLDPIFPKGTPLPTLEKKVIYKADRTLRPSEPGTNLAIKVWEGETLNDPEANWFLSTLLIRAEDIRFPIPEGSEIEIFIQLDASRRMKVEAFVPKLNAHFSDNLYVPQRDMQEAASLLDSLPQQVEGHQKRLEALENYHRSGGDAIDLEELERLELEIENLYIELTSSDTELLAKDADRAKLLMETSREIRQKLSKLEQRTHSSLLYNNEVLTIDRTLSRVESTVRQHGTPYEQEEFVLLGKQIERCQEANDTRGLAKLDEELWNLRWRVVSRQAWFWKDWLDTLLEPNQAFVDKVEAQKWLESGKKAAKEDNLKALQEAVRHLWELQPKDAPQVERERGMVSGLRKA